MSKKRSKQAPALSADIERMIERLVASVRPDPLTPVIRKVSGWTPPDPDICFPMVYRAWMSYSAFLRA